MNRIAVIIFMFVYMPIANVGTKKRDIVTNRYQSITYDFKYELKEILNR